MDTDAFKFIAIGGFVLAIFLFMVGIRHAHRLGLTDKPGGRKQHEGSIPLIGGLIIVPVFAGMGLFAGLQDVMPFIQLLAGSALLLVVGAMDDKIHLSAWTRFFLQIAVSIYAVFVCGSEIENLGNLFGFGDAHLGMFAWFFSATCFVLLINAINMLDGVDGLAGGFVSIALGWFMFIAYQNGQMTVFWPMLFLLIPLLAFLIFNARHPLRDRASVFLGDAGSLSLALLLGWFAINSAQGGEEIAPMVPAVVIIWILTLPIMDTFAIFFVRMKQGRSPFSADRLHAHYKIIDHGYSPRQTTYILWGASILTGAIGYFGIQAGVPEYVLLYSWSAILGGYTYHRLKHA